MKNKLILTCLIFICNVVIFLVCDYIENREKSIKFTITISAIFTVFFMVIMCVIPDPKPVVKPIIVKPPQWVYTYYALEEQLPDNLIREVLKYQYIDDPKHIDFNIYK